MGLFYKLFRAFFPELREEVDLALTNANEPAVERMAEKAKRSKRKADDWQAKRSGKGMGTLEEERGHTVVDHNRVITKVNSNKRNRATPTQPSASNVPSRFGRSLDKSCIKPDADRPSYANRVIPLGSINPVQKPVVHYTKSGWINRTAGSPEDAVLGKRKDW